MSIFSTYTAFPTVNSCPLKEHLLRGILNGKTHKMTIRSKKEANDVMGKKPQVLPKGSPGPTPHLSTHTSAGMKK